MYDYVPTHDSYTPSNSSMCKKNALTKKIERMYVPLSTIFADGLNVCSSICAPFLHPKNILAK